LQPQHSIGGREVNIISAALPGERENFNRVWGISMQAAG
jgi:hypothetical protein